jgi:menaquinone-9 beta-reductase
MSTSQFPISIGLDSAQERLYDVIVVGAGPAGSSAAYHLSKNGANVLLVDRYSFPRDKRCGDAVMPPALEELSLMGLADAMHQRFVAAAQIGMSLHDRPLSYHPVGEKGVKSYVAPRKVFDALLCEHAIRHGAAWLDQVTVQEVLPGKEHALVHGVRGNQPLELRARLVIAADGSGSRLARKLRDTTVEQSNLEIDSLTAPRDDRARSTALRGYFSGIKGTSDALEFYFRNETGTTYYWIFPVSQNLANVGVIASMAQLRASKTDLTNALTAFLQIPGLAERTAHARLVGQLGAAPIAAGLRGSALFGERMLCVGDAAALVEPSSAEGISGALWSGRMAAGTAISALKQNDFSPRAFRDYGTLVRSRYQAPYDAFFS